MYELIGVGRGEWLAVISKKSSHTAPGVSCERTSINQTTVGWSSDNFHSQGGSGANVMVMVFFFCATSVYCLARLLLSGRFEQMFMHVHACYIYLLYIRYSK